MRCMFFTLVVWTNVELSFPAQTGVMSDMASCWNHLVNELVAEPILEALFIHRT